MKTPQRGGIFYDRRIMSKGDYQKCSKSSAKQRKKSCVKFAFSMFCVISCFGFGRKANALGQGYVFPAPSLLLLLLPIPLAHSPDYFMNNSAPNKNCSTVWEIRFGCSCRARGRFESRGPGRLAHKSFAQVTLRIVKIPPRCGVLHNFSVLK